MLATFRIFAPVSRNSKEKKRGGFAYDLGYYRPQTTKAAAHPIFDDETNEEELDEDVRSDFLVSSIEDSQEKLVINPSAGEFLEIGNIVYDNGYSATIGFQENQSQVHGIQINNQQNVLGVSISSHRSISVYQPVQGLSLQLVTIANAYQAFFSEYINRQNGGHTQFSPLYRMKETLIAMAAFGEGNQHLERNSELSAAFDGFGKILRKFLPKELGFQKLLVRVPDNVLKTRACYEPDINRSTCLSMRQVKATICKPASVVA